MLTMHYVRSAYIDTCTYVSVRYVLCGGLFRLKRSIRFHCLIAYALGASRRAILVRALPDGVGGPVGL
jgi:hypothetical protein